VPPLPVEVYIEPTNRCNELCVTCPRTLLTREPDADLDLSSFTAILDQFPRVERVVLHGLGEPLLARELPLMIAECNRRGARALFNTNALALSRRVGEQLIASGLDELRVSMDAADAKTYRAVRGVDGYERALRRTAAFTELVRTHATGRPKVSLYFMAMRENLGQLPGVIQRAGEIGVSTVVLQRLVYFGEGLAVEEQSVMNEDLTSHLEECQAAATRANVELQGTGGFSPADSLRGVDSRRPWSGCTRPWRSTYVTANGNVLPCCFAPFTARDYDGAILGNLSQAPLAQVWNGPKYEEFRRAHQSDDPPEICRGCGTRWMY